MLTAEGQAAVQRRGVGDRVRGWLRGRFESRTEAATRQLAEARSAWDGPGPVSVTQTHLVLGTDCHRRRASLATIATVAHEGRAVWVRRRRAHDWLVRCEDEADAARLADAIRAATDAQDLG